MKKYWEDDLDYPDENALKDLGNLDSRGERYTDNGLGITARALEIGKMTCDIDHVASRLASVGLDKVAQELFVVARIIRDTAQPIPGIVSKELNTSIRHAEHMIGGLLGVALKLGDKEAEISRLKQKS